MYLGSVIELFIIKMRQIWLDRLFQICKGNKILNVSSKEQISIFKKKLKEEIRSGLKKDKIFKEDERILLKSFIKKIVRELELNKID